MKVIMVEREEGAGGRGAAGGGGGRGNELLYDSEELLAMRASRACLVSVERLAWLAELAVAVRPSDQQPPPRLVYTNKLYLAYHDI